MFPHCTHRAEFQIYTQFNNLQIKTCWSPEKVSLSSAIQLELMFPFQSGATNTKMDRDTPDMDLDYQTNCPNWTSNHMKRVKQC